MPFICVLLSLACAASAQALGPAVTPAPAGPYRIRQNRIVDANNHLYVIRGTRLPSLNLAGKSSALGAFSRTTFVTLRQRLNMNAVRLPIHAGDYETNGRYRTRVKEIVRQANQFELLVILELDAPAPDSFWTRCAADFKDFPNLFFATPAVSAIRSAGATQPVIVSTADPQSDPNILYEISPSYASLEADRAQIAALSSRVPVIANGLDPHLDRAGPECAAFPADPAAASKLLHDLLVEFDDRAVSWTISTMESGKLLDNFVGYNWTKLDVGWTCGQFTAYAGIGMMLLSHLWSANPHGVLTVNLPAGGFVVARGGNSSAYGRILAQSAARAERPPFPVKLSDISIRITDSRGVARLAPLEWTGAGWAHVNLVLPPDSAVGLAEAAVVRSDGSETTSRIIHRRRSSRPLDGHERWPRPHRRPGLSACGRIPRLHMPTRFVVSKGWLPHRAHTSRPEHSHHRSTRRHRIPLCQVGSRIRGRRLRPGRTLRRHAVLEPRPSHLQTPGRIDRTR